MQAPEFRAPGSKVHQRADLLKAFGARISVIGCVAIRMAVMVAVLVLLSQSAKAQVTFGTSATKSTDDQCGCNTAQTTVTLPFTIGSGSNVLLLLNVHIRSTSTTSSPTVLLATFTPAVGPVLPFSFIQGDTFVVTTNPIKNAVRGEQYRLTQIPIGAGTITVTLTGAARFIVGAVEFFGVNPTHPIRANNINKANSNIGSVCLPACGNPLVCPPLQAGDIMVDGLSTDDTAGPIPLAPQVLIYGVGTH